MISPLLEQQNNRIGAVLGAAFRDLSSGDRRRHGQASSMQRCSWAGTDPLMIAYHDGEWGTPVHDDRVLFEFLILEGAQAGLSWSTILHRRDGYRRAYRGFDPAKVARFGERDAARLVADESIIRNKAKIAWSIRNAQAFLAVQRECGSFGAYLWEFAGGAPVVNRPRTIADVPATSELSDALSKDLRRRGFGFVGSTICYAFLQAVGVVNDHAAGCFRAPKLRTGRRGRSGVSKPV